MTILNTKNKALISLFEKNGGILRFSTIIKAGFHSDTLVALEKKGVVQKTGRGIYCLTKHSIGSYPDLVMASIQAPRGVICLVSALAFHEATNEIPKSVDIAIPRRSHANRIKYPPVRIYQFSQPAWQVGIEEHDIGGHKVKVYDLPKTIADCFKYRNKIGIDVAREALKVAVAEMHVKPQEIMKYAKICRVEKVIKPILEALI